MMGKKKKKKKHKLLHKGEVMAAKNTRPKKVVLSWDAYNQFRVMGKMQASETSEFSAYAPVFEREDGLYIPKFYAATQVNSSASTHAEIDEKIIGDVCADYPDMLDSIFTKIKCHIHTHPQSVGLGFSGIDDRLADDWFDKGDEDYLLMLLVTPDMKMTARIDFCHPFRHRIENLYIEYELPEMDGVKNQQWKDQLKDRSSKYVYTQPEVVTPNKYGGNTYGYHGFRQDNVEDYYNLSSGSSCSGYSCYGGNDDLDMDLEEAALSKTFTFDCECPYCGGLLSDFELLERHCYSVKCNNPIPQDVFNKMQPDESEMYDEMLSDYLEKKMSAVDDASTKAGFVTEDSKNDK